MSSDDLFLNTILAGQRFFVRMLLKVTQHLYMTAATFKYFIIPSLSVRIYYLHLGHMVNYANATLLRSWCMSFN